MSDNDPRIIQLRELNENQRALFSLFWQQPSLIVSMASALVIASYVYISEDLVVTHFEYLLLRTLLIFIASMFSFTSCITAIKHRFFRAIWIEKINDLESELNLPQTPLYTSVSSHPRGKNYLLKKISGEKCLIYTIGFLTLGFFILCVNNFWRIYLVLDP